MPPITKKVCPGTREAWRDWLQKYHKKEKLVWLIKHKRHTGKPTITNIEAMEEAICFGWIDTVVKRIDDEKYAQCFVRRNDKSRWSNNTLSRARKMIKENKMAPEGLKRYKEGVKKPVIDHGFPKNPKVPEDLKKELRKDKKAEENFKKFAPSYKKYYIYWIEKAKMSETRSKRIKEVVQRSHDNKKLGE